MIGLEGGQRDEVQPSHLRPVKQRPVATEIGDPQAVGGWALKSRCTGSAGRWPASAE